MIKTRRLPPPPSGRLPYLWFILRIWKDGAELRIGRRQFFVSRKVER